jgi:hypothetical protein
MFYVVEWTKTPRGQVVIHCPLCDQKPVQAVVFDRRERALLLGLIPLLVLNSTWVTCTACRGELHSKVKSEHLFNRDPEELAAFIYARVSFIDKFLAISALLLAVFPLLGLLYALLAWVVNRKSRGWPKKVTVIALWVSIAVHVLFGLIAVAANLGKGR